MSQPVIPTTTSVVESSVIPAHISQVWHLIKLPSFHSFWNALKSCEEVKGASPDTDVIRWVFKDGTAQEVKQEEHSVRSFRGFVVDETDWELCIVASVFRLTEVNLQTINHFITYSVIASAPPLSYTSVLSTIRCFEVTSGPHAGATFVQWSGQFSGDADTGGCNCAAEGSAMLTAVSQG